MFPPEVNNLPEAHRDFYQQVYNDVITRQSADIAHVVAWEATKQALVQGLPSQIPVIVPETPKPVEIEPLDESAFVTFDLKPTVNQEATPGLVVHAVGDELVFEGMLDDTMMNKQGKRWSTRALEAIAEQINKFGIKGDFKDDLGYHEQIKQLYRQYGNLSDDRAIAAMRQERKGILRAFKAIIQDGKLWIRGVVDKRYKNHLEKFQHISLEAFVPKEYRTGDVYEFGHILGFQCVDNNGAVNPRSNITIVEA